MPTDAESRYLERVQEDCELILGAGVEILDLAWTTGEGQRLTVRYRLDDVEAETIAEADTVIAAHARLREALVEDRVRLGFTVLTEVLPAKR
jgi:hypothetical protein